MSTERLTSAMERIDRALARIETQAALAGSVPNGEAAAAAHAKLVAEHEKLRGDVGACLADLDAVIAEIEG